MEPKVVPIHGEMITLGQLLKKLDLIRTGGEAKYFLQSVEVRVNGVLETRRGRKLYPGDLVEVKNHGVYKVEGK